MVDPVFDDDGSSDFVPDDAPVRVVSSDPAMPCVAEFLVR